MVIAVAAAPPNSNNFFLVKAGIEEENKPISFMYWEGNV